MQTREGIFDLTREAFVEGGPAFELAPAVAHVWAEAGEALEDTPSDDVHGVSAR